MASLALYLVGPSELRFFLNTPFGTDKFDVWWGFCSFVRLVSLFGFLSLSHGSLPSCSLRRLYGFSLYACLLPENALFLSHSCGL